MVKQSTLPFATGILGDFDLGAYKVSMAVVFVGSLGRLVSVVIISTFLNKVWNRSDNTEELRDTNDDFISTGHMVMLWTAGIRGPTALCLVYEFPSSTQGAFVSLTLFTIVAT